MQPSKFGRFLVALSDAVDRAVTFLAVVGTIAFAGVMLLGVFFRYVLNDSLSWSDEMALIIFGWVAFLFIASAYLHDKHVNLDILIRRLGGAWRGRTETLAQGLAAGYLLALLVAAFQAFDVVARSRTDALQIPMMAQFVAMPLAVVVMLIHWARRNVAQVPPRHMAAKLAIALGYFCVVLLPIGEHVHLEGGVRTLVLAGALFGPMLIGVPVALSLGLMATLYVALVGDVSFMTDALQTFYGVNVYALMAIPLLILSGKLMHAAGVAKLLVDFAQMLVGRVRGGLGASNVVASFIFGDISGSAVSDTASIGSLMVPQMKQRGYAADFCAALQGSAGALGMMAPLSITVLLYSAAANVSVSRLAAATIVPSCLVAASFMALVIWHARRHGYPREHVTLAMVPLYTLRAVPGLLALVLIIGGILGGVFTPAEVGVILLVYVLFLTIFVYRAGQPRKLYSACVEAGHITGMTLFMVCTSGFVGFVMARDLVSVQLVDAIAQVSMNTYFVLFVLSAVFVVLDMFLEPPAMIFGFLPTAMPLLAQAHIDLIHWGVLFAINMGLGCIVPPVALNLFVSTQLAAVQYGEAVRAAVPFMVIMAIDLVIVATFPYIPLMLPHLLFGYPLR
ncbi:MAG: TRAP transporter large permease subunit [Proteobacteria bacterium]|nr:TRAP transporter large permease subunit [Pseudomonadota bacterium]